MMARDKGVFISSRRPAAAPVEVSTALGDFSFVPSELSMSAPRDFCGGRIHVQRTPDAVRLSTDAAQDDFPAIACGENGRVVVTWQSWDGTRDCLMVAERGADGWWRTPRTAPGVEGDLYQPRPVIDAEGRAYAVWAWNRNGRWDLFAAVLDEAGETRPVRLTDSPGADFNHVPVRLPDGRVLLVWQGDRDGQYDVMIGEFTGGALRNVRALSDESGDDRAPDVAVSARGQVAVVWDSYRQGSFNVYMRRLAPDLTPLGPPIVIAGSNHFEAHATAVYDTAERLWIAWTDGGPNWGKHGRPAPRLHRTRHVRMCCLTESGRFVPVQTFEKSLDRRLRGMWEEPVLAAAANGAPVLVARHLMPIVRWNARRGMKERQSRGIWANFVSWYDGRRWTRPALMYGSGGRNMQRAAVARAGDGSLRAVWAGDGRRIERAEVPINNNVFAAGLPIAGPTLNLKLARDLDTGRVTPDPDPRPPSYTARVGERRLRLLFGDLHRHTDISRCVMSFDGSLIDTYRYAQDVVHLDFLGISDHDQDILKHRYDRIQRPLQTYMWWRSRKFCDLYTIPNRFTAVYGYEHGGSMKQRGGHKNVFFANRDNPCIEDDASEALFRRLEGRNAIAIPHQLADGPSATDWSKWNPRWEPVVEMFQARGSYEYLGAPRLARVKLPGHYLWDALGKGIRVGLIASSDHGLTHSAYACVYATDRTRAAILDALRKRRTYAATDTIILDVRLGNAFMGDEITVDEPPRIHAVVRGTGELRRIEIVRDGRFIYNRDPDGASCEIDFTDTTLARGESAWYYVRCIQENNEMAWSSPIWVQRR